MLCSRQATIGCDFLVKEMRVGDAQVTMQLWDTAGTYLHAAGGGSTARMQRGEHYVCVVTPLPHTCTFLPMQAKSATKA